MSTSHPRSEQIWGGAIPIHRGQGWNLGRGDCPWLTQPRPRQEQRWRRQQHRLPTHDKVGKRRQEKMPSRQMAVFTWFQCCLRGQAGMREGSGLLLSLTGTINFFLFPAEVPAQGERLHYAEDPRTDRLRSFAGSVSCLVTPPQSNYHHGMHNGLINN